MSSAPPDDPDDVRTKAREGIRQRTDPKTAEAYRLSIEGLRHLQRKELAPAADALARSAALNPADPVTAFRQASLLLARGRDVEALAAFERVVAMKPAAPPTALAASCLEAARLHEAAGDRPRAIELYSRAAGMRGADAATRHAATQSLDRLRVPPPSR
jgi:tetratricopeptide (TPR) repeat protein